MRQFDIITKKYDQVLLILIVILCAIGTVMLYSSSSSISMEETRGATDTLFLQSHLKRLLAGVIALFFFMLLDYRLLKKAAPVLLIGSLVLLMLTKLIYIFQGISFPARWLDIGFISIQTSDLARFSMIVYLAYYIDKKRSSIKDFYKGFFPPLILTGIVLSMIIIQPDFSTAAVIGLVCFVMLFLGGARLSHLLASGVISISILIPVMLMRSYRMDRVIYWLGSLFNNNQNQDQEIVGYQIQQSLISLGNGGFTGLGLGNSMEKNLFLPTPHTDFIFAIIGEELGLLGVIFILTLFLLVFQRCIKIAKDTTDPFGVILAVGLAFSFIVYAFINVAVVTSLVPTTGLPMPLISYGGSGLVVNLASLGILLNISQAKRSVQHRNGWKPKLYG
ncbi:MAG: putative peptidoglycan glycosyltransferase FtsW [Candidatus Neomarinimicrobiota bacterium]